MCMEANCPLAQQTANHMDRKRAGNSLPRSSDVTIGEGKSTSASAVEGEAIISSSEAPHNADSLAQVSESATRLPSATTTPKKSDSGAQTKRGARCKRRQDTDTPPAAVSPKACVKSAEELSVRPSLTTQSAKHSGVDIDQSDQNGPGGPGQPKNERQRVDEEPVRNASIATGVLTRRAKVEKQDVDPSTQQEKSYDHEAGDRGASGLVKSEKPLGDGRLRNTRGSRLRSQSTADPTWTEQRLGSVLLSSTLAAKQEEEAWESVTQAAIDAQERQLRVTLLSIFPPVPLQDAEVGRCPINDRDIRGISVAEEIKDNKTPSQRVKAVSAPLLTSSSYDTPLFSPEPLLPLLQALCEDKAYVHGAWCRYEDDFAVRRTQTSIQRKRQRHSFSKGGRKASARDPAMSGRRRDDGESAEESSADEEAVEEDELQPPESHWVEAPPAFTGGPRLLPTSSAPNARASAVAGGFQWTPWLFYRDKRRRVSRRPIDNGASSMTAKSAPVVGIAQSGPSSAVPSNSPASSGGVPPVAFSEVPSLPVLQVEADVPESAETVMTPMTPEERKGYARYVMSSGKLRHDCRDPYTFLVSRAKAMRIQWRRQHPIH